MKKDVKRVILCHKGLQRTKLFQGFLDKHVYKNVAMIFGVTKNYFTQNFACGITLVCIARAFNFVVDSHYWLLQLIKMVLFCVMARH